ncbi:hypothetical protein LTR56_027123 [Elasticomyces elasticus]|nr:hypothetical protein LTR56_027123 [Elasticomyces elasticus]
MQWNSMHWEDVDDYRPELFAIAGRLASCLAKQDAMVGMAGMHDLLLEYSKLRMELEALLDTSRPVGSLTGRENRNAQNYEFDPGFLRATISRGYASAFLVQTATAAWQILRSKEVLPEVADAQLPMTEGQLKVICKHHVVEMRHIIKELSDGRYGMVTSSALLSIIDSTWLGYSALERYSGHDLVDTRKWLSGVASHITSTGYSLLREPWGMVLQEHSSGSAT